VTLAPLTVVTPVRPGELGSLRAALAALPTGADSPFSAVRTAHFARWVVLDALPDGYPGAPFPPQRLRMEYLLFTTTFSGPVADHLEDLRTALGAVADTVWCACVGYPGTSRPRAFSRYLRHNSVRPSLFFAAHDRTVDDVRRALRLRERHTAFAQRCASLPDADLLQAFRDEPWEQP
jgi:hypothetical protein